MQYLKDIKQARKKREYRKTKRILRVALWDWLIGLEGRKIMDVEWVMVIITGVYVAATIAICIANFKSANATNNQLKELKRQYDEENKPYITTELIFEKRNYYGLRFTNHGRRIAENVRIDLDSQFVECLQDIYKQHIKVQNGKECFIGIGQHYDLFFANTEIRDQANLVPAKGEVTYKSSGKEYNNIFEFDLNKYMSFFSVKSEGEEIREELNNQKIILEKINKSIIQIAKQDEKAKTV